MGRVDTSHSCFLQVRPRLFLAFVADVACIEAIDDLLSDVHLIVDVEDVVTDAAENHVVTLLLVVLPNE